MATLFEELPEELLLKLRQQASDYSPDVYENELLALEKEVKMYEKLGSDFRAEYRTAKRSYDSLSTINNWMRSYNCSNVYLDEEVVVCENVVRVKAYFDQSYVKYMKFEDYIMYSGIFTPIMTYVIPLTMLGIDRLPDVTEGQTTASVTKYLHKKVQNIELHPENRDPRLPEVSEVNYGTIRVISSTHCAVVAKSQRNPFAESIRSACNWNFIRGDGTSC